MSITFLLFLITLAGRILLWIPNFFIFKNFPLQTYISSRWLIVSCSNFDFDAYVRNRLARVAPVLPLRTPKLGKRPSCVVVSLCQRVRQPRGVF